MTMYFKHVRCFIVLNLRTLIVHLMSMYIVVICTFDFSQIYYFKLFGFDYLQYLNWTIKYVCFSSCLFCCYILTKNVIFPPKQYGRKNILNENENILLFKKFIWKCIVHFSKRNITGRRLFLVHHNDFL